MSAAHRISKRVQSRIKNASLDWDPTLAGQTSELITRLQKIRARSTATTQGTFITSSHASHSCKRPRHGHNPDIRVSANDELHWQANLLTWTRGSTLMRTFSFSSPVLQAFWTLFHVSSTDDIQMAPGKTRSDRQSHPLARALCVFFEQAIHIHFPGLGEQVDMDLPFRFAIAFPAPVGFLVQRQIESEDERIASRLQQPSASSSLPTSTSYVGYPFPDLGNTTDSSYTLSHLLDETDHASTSQLHEDSTRLLPMVFYLSRCYDDLVPVDRFPQLSFSSRPLIDPKPMTHGPASPFGEIDETVVYVSTDSDDHSPSIVVTTSQTSSAIRIYAFAARPSAFEATATLLSTPCIHSTLSSATANGKASATDVQIPASTSEGDEGQQASANGHYNMTDTPAASMAPSSTALGRGYPTNVRRSARVDLERRTSGMTTAGMGRDPSGRSRRISAMHSGTADRRSTGRKDDQASQGRDRTLGNISHTADGLRLQSQAYQHEAMMEELGAAGTSMRISTNNPASAARIRHSSQAAARTPYGGPRISNRTASSAIKNRPSMNLPRLDTSIDTGRLTSGLVTGAGEGVRADAMDTDNGLIEDDNVDLVRLADMDSFARSFASVCLLDEIKVPGIATNLDAATVHVQSASFARVDSDATYVFLSVPSTNQTFTRRLGYQRLGSAARSRHLPFCKSPSKLQAFDVIPTSNLAPVRSLSSDSTEVVTVSPEGVYKLHLGPPSASLPALDVSDFEPLVTKLKRLPDGATPYAMEPVNGTVGSTVQIKSSTSSERTLVDIDLRPKCSTTARVLTAFRQVLPHKLHANITSQWIRARFLSESKPLRQSEQAAADRDWSALLDVFRSQRPSLTHDPEDVQSGSTASSLAHLLFGDDPLMACLAPLQAVQPAGHRAEATDAITETLEAAEAHQAASVLYLLAEETCLDSSNAHGEASKIAQLAVSLAHQHSAEAWIDSLSRRFSVGNAEHESKPESFQTKSISATGFESPPKDLYQVLTSKLSGSAEKMVTLRGWLDLKEDGTSMASSDAAKAFPVINALLQTYAVFARADLGHQHLSTSVVEAMISHGLDLERLRRLPFGVALPLYQALRCCQINPPSGKSADFYRIVQRAEVVMNTSTQRSSLSTASARHIPTQLVRTLPEDAPLDAICAQLFSRDFRLRDVVAMLRTDTINSVYVAEGENQTEAFITEQHNAAVAAIGERTKALSPGRAMLFMTSRSFSPTQKWRISSLCLAVKVRPRGTTIEPDNKADTAGLDWPEFHNGVASVLELNLMGGMHIDSKWIFAHLGEQVTARHAGFLYGLGLMRQLPTLTPVHVFRYLKMRNNLLTIGFLLGMAVSTVGTADPTARHLIGMQLTAFLPPGSAPLNLSTITQTAGLLAMGLVFLGSNHRWTAKRMLDQIGAQECPVPNIQPQHREAYSLSAGLALGLVYLGKGRSDGMKSLPDKRIIARLAHLIKGSGDANDDVSLSGKVSMGEGVKVGHEINLTSGPAALAFGLIYLRSNNNMIADVTGPPQTQGELDMLRPDVLFAHVLARSLILWDSIEPTREWLEGVLPEWMQKRIKTGKPLPEAAQLAQINMQAGACFAIGLKYAGSKDQTARDRLWMQLDTLEKQVKVQTVSFFSKIRRAAVRAALDQVRISLAMVMAGSGDVDLLRHLRRAHGDVDAETCYGSHMVTHMALGLLFLGGGRFTLGTSDLGVAALLISFLPPFPRSSGDNRAHLQAFRHLWYFAIEPRLLVATDIDTNQLVSLPVKIAAAAETTASDAPAFTPLLLPNQRLVGPIESATFRYWPASIDSKSVGARSGASGSAALVAKASSSTASQILFVKRKTAHLDYLADPHASRSLSTRAQETAPMDVSSDATAVVGPGSAELQEAMRGFAAAGKHRELVRSLSRVSTQARPEGAGRGDAVVPLLRTVVMECLTMDKTYMLPTYAQIAHLEQLGQKDTRAWLRHYRDLRFADEFYRHHYKRLFSDDMTGDTGNQPQLLVQPGLLAILRLRAQQHAKALFEGSTVLQEAIVDHLTTKRDELPIGGLSRSEADAFWTVLTASEAPSADEVRDLTHAIGESIFAWNPAAGVKTEEGCPSQLKASVQTIAEAAFGGTERPPWTTFILDRITERLIRRDLRM